MTFSDAEDDQPSGNHAGQSTSTEDQINPDGESNEQAAQAVSNGPTIVAAPQDTVASKNEPNSDANVVTNRASNSLDEASSIENTASSSVQSVAPTASVRSASEQVMDAAQAVIQEAEQDTSKSLNSERILHKLQQIQSYIHQTSTAMESLEQEGDITKIGQYNTLAKVVRELKSTQVKLISHLTKLKAKSDEEKSVDVQQEPPKNDSSPQKSGSEMVGVVCCTEGDMPLPTMREELERHSTEQEHLASRLRDSLTRRQDLMARYRNTRERLNTLKNQRTNLAQHERRILQAEGANENPYDDPVPGADTWSLEELRSAQSDFRVLRDKVNHLEGAYKAKRQATDASETETIADVDRKLQQLTDKRMQIELALRQLADLEKLRSEEAQGNSNGGQPSITNPNPPNTVEERLHSGNVRVVPADIDDVPRDSELEARKEYLSALETQLATMKNLLAQKKRENAAARGEDVECVDSSASAHDSQAPQSEILAESSVVGVSGGVLNLSEDERRDPEIISKYRQLTDAKSRLSKMESVMSTIAQASATGRRLEEVLSPTSLQLLREARAEYEESENDNVPSRSRANEDSTPLNLHAPSELMSAKEKLSEMENLLSIITEAAASGHQLEDVLTKEQIDMIEGDSENASDEATGRDSSIPRDASNTSDDVADVNNVGFRPIEPASSRTQFQHQISNPRGASGQSSSISGVHSRADMGMVSQQEFRKAAAASSNVNDVIRSSESSIKENNSEYMNNLAKYDYNPHLMEVAKLKDELVAKKNTLEGLMQQLGKGDSDLDLSSSNVDVEPPSPTGAENNFTLSRLQSKETYQSDEDLVDSSYGIARSLYTTQSNQAQQRADSMPPMQKNQSRPENGNQSVNNLSVRPKQNELRGSSIPSTLWEVQSLGLGPNHVVPPPKSPNTAAQVHNTVSSALLQLNQVQESINSLCENLKQGKMADAYSSNVNTNNMGHLNPVSNRNVHNMNNVYMNQLNPNSNLVNTNVNLSNMNEFHTTSTSNANVNSNHPALNNVASMNNLPTAYEQVNPLQAYGVVSPIPHQIGAVGSQPMLNAQAPQNPLLEGLQQCFSQLQLQSMEIQALSKGMQVRPQLPLPSSQPNTSMPMPGYPPVAQFAPISSYPNIPQYPTMPQYPPPSQPPPIPAIAGALPPVSSAASTLAVSPTPLNPANFTYYPHNTQYSYPGYYQPPQNPPHS